MKIWILGSSCSSLLKELLIVNGVVSVGLRSQSPQQRSHASETLCFFYSVWMHHTIAQWNQLCAYTAPCKFGVQCTVKYRAVQVNTYQTNILPIVLCAVLCECDKCMSCSCRTCCSCFHSLYESVNVLPGKCNRLILVHKPPFTLKHNFTQT